MPGHTHGFLYLNSQFTSLDVPGSVWTTTTSINDRGDVVGNFGDSKGFIHGFSYTNGVFHIIDVPGAQFTVASGINNQGVIVGYSFFGAVAQSYQLSGNSFTMINLPFSSDSFAFGINNSGTMVGGYDNGVEADNYGFFGSPGNFVPFGFPGFESQTLPVGVNSRKDVVGTYYDPFVSGFARIGQTFQRLNAPGAFYTFLHGINDRGMIVGSYRNRSGTHAVLLNPAGK